MQVLILILILAISHDVLAQLDRYTPVELINGEYSQEVQDLREYGAQVAGERAIESGELPNGDYAITETYSVGQQIANGINYQYEVELSNQENVRVRARYIVHYMPWTNNREVISYTIDGISNDESIISIEEELFLSSEEELLLDREEVVLAEEEDLVPGYTRLDLDYVNTDKSVQEILNYGVEYVTQSAVSQGRLPDNRFSISGIYSVSRQIINGANYKCDVEITDRQGLYLRTHFEVHSKPWIDIQVVTYYTYQITSIPRTEQYENYEEGETYAEEVAIALNAVEEVVVIPEDDEEVINVEENP